MVPMEYNVYFLEESYKKPKYFGLFNVRADFLYINNRNLKP